MQCRKRKEHEAEEAPQEPRTVDPNRPKINDHFERVAKVIKK